MSLYLDSSALLKTYLDEPDSARFDEVLRSDPDWTTARHTLVEIRRTLARRLPADALSDVRRTFDADWARMQVLELDEQTCRVAADIAEVTGVRTLDALHLAAARRAGGGLLPIVTADLRQAQAARSLGLVVLGS